ncbi:Deoxynucleoside kinase [Humidesulfovibrio mexicanus]|uniref:Deoxynucleoside kinase n=1 Tax=Humidesulfovibrio mexicanus TaxID=147047 RepID=A0A239B759_9BACT|nr:deoxynucleoside kinase [Humidesulfovibrio mexicanus]SNS03128.1 Deoxynucleoside kinase [Humidesulfovibrio mexicanus]
MRVEVCGSIATGKTTFASFANVINLDMVEEQYKKNPFLEVFYGGEIECSFETELSFLLIHYHQIKASCRPTCPSFVCDFSLILDNAYADVTLLGHRLEIFQNISEDLMLEVGHPNILVHLVCPEDVLLERVRKRGRASEQVITMAYLKKVADALERRVDEASKSVPVLRIDSHEHDFRDGLEGHDFLATLLEHLK